MRTWALRLHAVFRPRRVQALCPMAQRLRLVQHPQVRPSTLGVHHTPSKFYALHPRIRCSAYTIIATTPSQAHKTRMLDGISTTITRLINRNRPRVHTSPISPCTSSTTKCHRTIHLPILAERIPCPPHNQPPTRNRNLFISTLNGRRRAISHP